MQVVDPAVVHDDLNKEARAIRQKIAMRWDPGDLFDYIRAWSEEDNLDGAPCRALVVILKTRGCTWALAGGCTMCGYANESAWSKVSEEQLVEQFSRAWRKYSGEELVKIYTSGSFLDKYEVMEGAQRRILEIIGKGPKKVAFEARPDYIHEHSFDHLEGLCNRLEVGIGVESHNLRVLRDSVNKGHGFEAFPKAAAICHAHGVSVKSYLMLKPPYMKESDALQDSPETIRLVAPHADVVSLNPTNVQGNTVVDALFARGSYRPPWLWTIVEVLLRGKEAADAQGFKGVMKSDVIALGQSRGAHNCGRCDEEVGAYVKKFKATQDPKWLRECLARVECGCRREWELVRELGPLVPAYGEL